MFLTGSSGVKRAACSACSQIWNHTLCCSHCTRTPEADVWLWQKTREKSKVTAGYSLTLSNLSKLWVVKTTVFVWKNKKHLVAFCLKFVLVSAYMQLFFFFFMLRLPHQFDCSSCTKAGGMFYMISAKQSACACCSRMFWIFWKGKSLLFCLTLNWLWKVSRFSDFFGTRREKLFNPSSVIHSKSLG